MSFRTDTVKEKIIDTAIELMYSKSSHEFINKEAYKKTNKKLIV